MGLLVFSVVVALVLGCVLWLVLGNRLPPGSGSKWSSVANIAAYTGLFALLILGYLFLSGT